jgi:peptidoglycan hydrolase CwlO-like protein
LKGLRKLGVLLLAALIAGSIPSEGIVVEATSIQDKINQNQKDKEALEGKLDQKQEELEGLKGEQSTLKGELKNLNKQLTQVSDNLADLEQQIQTKTEEIQVTQANLEDARATEKWQYACMVTRVRDMYERNDTTYMNAILGGKSFGQMLNAADIFERIADYDNQKLDEFKETRHSIEEQEAKLQQEKIELENLKVAAEAEKNKVSGLIGQTSGNIAAYAEQIAEAEEQALAYEKQIKEKENTLEQLKKELALSQAAAAGSWRDISEVNFAEGDRYLLANLIYCEAGGEPYEGQLAVGSVVINRVLSGKFPDTVVGVIYQNRQFSPVASGRLELALAANKATARCYQAADAAMSGVTNVGNCVFFRTPIEGLTGINIGGHVFY